MHVLRLCSVFEPPPDLVTGRAAAYDPIGGMQNHTGALTRALDRRGLRQTVVTSRLGGPAGRTPFGTGAVVHRVGAPLRRLRQLWAAAAVPVALGRRRGPVDVVHAHQGEDLALLPLAVAAARRHGCPLVVTLHTSVRHTVRPIGARNTAVKAVGGPLEALLVRRADRVIVLTRRAAAGVTGAGVDPARVAVIPSGWEAAAFAGAGASPEPFPAVGRPRVVYVGRLAAQKGVDVLVDAFGLVRAPRAQLVIVGDGPDRPRVETAARRSPAADRVHLVGFVPHDRVPSVLATADVLVLPSRYEELGSVLLEGLRAGVPIVATDVGGIPEAVEDGVTGLLVPPDDPGALAAAVDRVLADGDLAARMATAARTAAGRYDWDALADEVFALYRALA